MANLPMMLCIILSLCTLSLSDNVFVSIDCGSSSSDPYRDENGIIWTSDTNYVNGGESRSVQPSNSSSHVMDTLRVFTNKTRNCFVVNSVKQGRVLLRASFYYGNYDGKNSPPSFDLMFDGNFWATVDTSGSRPAQFEVIYVTKKKSVSVCVAQIEAGQYPFVSALEVRSLEWYIYKFVDDSVPLFTRRRLAFGSNETIRYPDDPYDRLWSRDNFLPAGAIQVSGDALLGSGTPLDDSPPPAVLKSAIVSPSLNSPIHLFMALPSSSNVSVYINWYFSEVTRLQPNQTRAFYIFKDNQIFSAPIIPPYDNGTQMFINSTLASSNTSFSLVPANDSTLPPLINAMEVFRLGDTPLVDGTNKNDVQGLASLQEEFSLLQGWSGDPCLPALYKWDWIKCNDDAIPRVTSLVLGGYGLSGLLPNFSSMDALQTIDLSNNSLTGSIPGFLGTFPNLTVLNLQNNQLNGTIPASLSSKKNIILRVDGNPGLCASNTSCPIPAPASNTSVRKTKKVLETLFAAIVSSIIVLQLS